MHVREISGHRMLPEDGNGVTASQTVWLTATGLSLIAVCYGLARFAYGLFVPAFRNAFDLDATAAGTIASASYAAYCVAVLFATVLTPKLGARTVAVSAGILATAGTAVIGVAPNAAVLALGVVIAGSSTGVASPPLAHAVSATVAERRHDRVQTVINSGTGLGVLASGPVALLVQDQWRVAWLAFAFICAVVTVWVAVVVPGLPDRQPRSAPAQPTFRTLFPDPLLAVGAPRLLFAAMVLGVASSATWTFGRDLLGTVGGYDHNAAAMIWIALGACGLFGAAAGDVAERIGMRGAWPAMTLLLALSTGFLALAPGIIAIAASAAAAFGAAYIALTGLLLIWGTRVYSRQPAAGVGLAFLMIALGQALGAPLIGLVVDRASLSVAFWVAAALALLGATVRPGAPGRPRAVRR